MIRSIDHILAEHPFFRELPKADLFLIGGCGKNQVFKTDSYIASEGDGADHFYVIRQGQVAIQINVPGRGPVTLETLSDGDVFGWSWLFPPYKWTFDAQVMSEAHVIALDGRCLRKKADEDPELGYRLMKKFAQIMTERIKATRLQLLDLYGGSKE